MAVGVGAIAKLKISPKRNLLQDKAAIKVTSKYIF